MSRAEEAPSAPEAGEPARPLAGSFAATGFIQLLQAVIGVLLARVLGPDDRGELAAVILWPTLIMTLGNLGLAQAATYHAARAPRLGTLAGSVLALVAIESVVLVGLGAAVLPPALSGHEGDVVRTAQLFLAAFVPLSLLALAMMSILNGLHRFRWFHGLRILMIGITFAGLIGLGIADELTVQSAAVVYVAGQAVAALLATVVVLRSARGVREVSPLYGGQTHKPPSDSLGVSRKTVRSLLSFGLRSHLSTSMWALNERVDQLVISIVLSSASLGLYVVAVTLTSLTTLIGFSFALVALPMLARMRARGDRQRTARVIVGATLAVATAVSVPILVAEPQIVRLLFGEEFSGSIDVGRVLLLAAIVFSLNRVLEAVLQAEGRPLDSSIGEAVGLAVTAAGLAVLLPAIGILGAGITSLLAYAASAAFLTRRAARALSVSPRQLLTPDRETFGGLREMLSMRHAREPRR